MENTMVQVTGRQDIAGYFSKDAFKEKRKMILVLKTGVAGLHYNLDLALAEDRELVESLKPGTELKLFRDTDNEHDRWAVSVYTADGRVLGYVSRFKNETVARLMDYGKVFHAIVDEKPEPPKDATEARRTIAPTESFEIPFSIYMEE